MARTVTMKLKTESIQNVLDIIREIKDEVATIANDLVQTLVDYGVERAKFHIITARPTAAVETWELYESIEGIYNASNGKGIIRSTSGHAFFVEFGTGIYGADVNGHGEAGWWYFDKKEGRKRWTQGEPPRPFMYQTYLDLCAKANDSLRIKISL